jgi:hypothetical protein
VIHILEEELDYESESKGMLLADECKKISCSECDDRETDVILLVPSHKRRLYSA